MAETQEPAQIAPDTFDDAESAHAVSIQSSTTSLRTSVVNFYEENGRRYHTQGSGRYILPTDDMELERLELQHNLFQLTLDNKLCLCPNVDGAKRVLDAGTGTGAWAIDFADAHPDAEVTGVDLVPTAPGFVPKNCKFEVDDIEKEWVWSKPFDFIFARGLAGSLADPHAFIQKAFDNLEPGGYFEMEDITLPVASDDGTLTPDSYLVRMSHMTVEAGERMGRPMNLGGQYKELFEKAGFVDVVQRRLKWPSNIWPRDKKFKEMGRWNLANIDGNLEGLTLVLFTHGLGMSPEETRALCEGARKEVRDVHIHAYWPVSFCYGRKPENPKAAE